MTGSSTTTTVRPTAAARAAIMLGWPAAGAVVGLASALAVEWAAQTTGFSGILGFADHVGEPVGLLTGAVIGLALGLVLAVTTRMEGLHVVVSDGRATLTWDRARVSVPRRLVREVVVAEDLVLLGSGGVELARVRCDVDRRALALALARHGYPAPATTDPHEPDFHPWDPADGLGPELTALLTARARTLADGEHGDAEYLRRQLAARGLMVRDVHRRGRRAREQQWRVVPVLDEPERAEPTATGSVPDVVPAA